MGPKVEAAIRFVEGGGREAIITSLDKTAEALAGTTGTRVTR
jgi:carbamate kinase